MTNSLPFCETYLAEAAALFIENLARLRRAVPALSDRLMDPQTVQKRIAGIMAACGGVMALEDGKLTGYLGWWLADDFRGAGRKAAYCPEWAHAVAVERKAEVYRALYRAAAANWAAACCEVHAITLLAHDPVAERAWFWNGFGLLVVDAVRPMRGLDAQLHSDMQFRAATADDAAALAELDAEHCLHYGRSPIFMVPHRGETAAGWADFLDRPRNSVWLACDGTGPAGFMRFDGYEFDGAEVVESETTVKISGAYVRPVCRGRGAAAGMLDAALSDYAGRGFTACAVDFESFNPEAAAFWPRYFEPVCFSLMRVPENSPK